MCTCLRKHDYFPWFLLFIFLLGGCGMTSAISTVICGFRLWIIDCPIRIVDFCLPVSTCIFEAQDCQWSINDRCYRRATTGTRVVPVSCPPTSVTTNCVGDVINLLPRVLLGLSRRNVIHLEYALSVKRQQLTDPWTPPVSACAFSSALLPSAPASPGTPLPVQPAVMLSGGKGV